ncbi:response regulator transcription factor [Flavobacterium sp. CAU 1735]|uniref:response regulator transcription factor n=1 Tax=Flavobacterium sp. CAU 1735 TaxID=3140361 RepID=UPI00326012A2
MNLGLVDDHILFLESLSNFLKLSNSNIDIVFKAHDGRDMITKLQNCNTNNYPEAIITDIRMPEMDGYETIKWLKENHPEIRIIVLTQYNTPEVISLVFRLGANAFINKSHTTEELMGAISSIKEKGYYYTESVSEILHKAILAKDKQEPLSARELEIIKLIALQYTSLEIAEKLSINIRTLEAHTTSMIRNLNLKNRVGLVVYALENGLLNLKT